MGDEIQSELIKIVEGNAYLKSRKSREENPSERRGQEVK